MLVAKETVGNCRLQGLQQHRPLSRVAGLTLAGVYYGQREEVLTQRNIIKQQTLQKRRRHDLCGEEQPV